MMTNQNMVIADAKSGINMDVSMAISGSSLFSPAAAAAAPSTYITISNKKLPPSLDIISSGAKTNAWVDSMRASSPTRVKSSSPFSDDQNSWMVRHPSALNLFDEITSASKGKRIVMFLDYDGTLSPIVDDPDRAFMSDAMRATVRKLARYFPTAIVSGRCRDKVYSFVRLAELYYAGSHGMDIKGPSKGFKYKKSSCSFPASQ